MHLNRQGRAGASVLETTVVIAVIGVMLSILMPMLGMVRENALSTRCQQHLRALGIAVVHYMADYRFENWLPASGPAGGSLWFEKLAPFVGGQETGRWGENFVCPRAPWSQRGLARDTVSYGWNEQFLPFGTLQSKVANPDETIVIADSLAGPRCDVVLPAEGELRLDARHRERANVLFASGNVAGMTREEALFEWPRYWDRE